MNIITELRDKASVLKLTEITNARGRIIANQVAGFFEDMATGLEKTEENRIEHCAAIIAQYAPELPFWERKEMAKRILDFGLEVKDA